MDSSRKILTDNLLEELLAQDRVTLPEDTSYDVQLDKIIHGDCLEIMKKIPDRSLLSFSK